MAVNSAKQVFPDKVRNQAAVPHFFINEFAPSSISAMGALLNAQAAVGCDPTRLYLLAGTLAMRGQFAVYLVQPLRFSLPRIFAYPSQCPFSQTPPQCFVTRQLGNCRGQFTFELTPPDDGDFYATILRNYVREAAMVRADDGQTVSQCFKKHGGGEILHACNDEGMGVAHHPKGLTPFDPAVPAAPSGKAKANRLFLPL